MVIDDRIIEHYESKFTRKSKVRRNLFPSSGELNFKVEEPKKVLDLIEESFLKNVSVLKK